MIATIGTGGAAGDFSAGAFPANALPTAFAVSPDAFSGRAKREKRPRLENPELMFNAENAWKRGRTREPNEPEFQFELTQRERRQKEKPVLAG